MSENRSGFDQNPGCVECGCFPIGILAGIVIPTAIMMAVDSKLARLNSSLELHCDSNITYISQTIDEPRGKVRNKQFQVAEIGFNYNSRGLTPIDNLPPEYSLTSSLEELVLQTPKSTFTATIGADNLKIEGRCK